MIWIQDHLFQTIFHIIAVPFAGITSVLIFPLADRPSDSEKLSTVATNELLNVINKLHPHKAPGQYQITALMIQKLPPEGIQTLLHIYNSILRLNCWPVALKQAKVIMVPKPGKNPNEVSSYRPISPLPILSKILEKLILTKLTNEPNSMDWIPWHQFGFRKNHSTIQQCLGWWTQSTKH